LPRVLTEEEPSGSERWGKRASRVWGTRSPPGSNPRRRTLPSLQKENPSPGVLTEDEPSGSERWGKRRAGCGENPCHLFKENPSPGVLTEDEPSGSERWGKQASRVRGTRSYPGGHPRIDAPPAILTEKTPCQKYSQKRNLRDPNGGGNGRAGCEVQGHHRERREK